MVVAKAIMIPSKLPRHLCSRHQQSRVPPSRFSGRCRRVASRILLWDPILPYIDNPGSAYFHNHPAARVCMFRSDIRSAGRGVHIGRGAPDRNPMLHTRVTSHKHRGRIIVPLSFLLSMTVYSITLAPDWFSAVLSFPSVQAVIGVHGCSPTASPSSSDSAYSPPLPMYFVA